MLSLGLALFDLVAEANERTRMGIATRAGHVHDRESPEEFNLNVGTFIGHWTR